MLEIACFNLESALLATRYGVSRIELCSGATVGGTTPEQADFHRLKESTIIPVNIMIRPRGGSFIYTDEEFLLMQRSIETFRDQADGFVFGILTDSGSVDEERCSHLVRLANGKHCTFHRAFDECRRLNEAATAIIKCGFNAILTSGGLPTALEGAEVVQTLQGNFQGQISFIIAGSIRSGGARLLKEKMPAVEWFHSAAIVSQGEVANEIELEVLSKYLA
ncbi:hypothetical protein H072_8248 [Dactylellina haptotyla CBS 200.50]|uniref:Copper homeostasis protein cutC homolog n=1 Tax=Dactylellina haptotyla (strain CBS 200.50) TaxID=1284197 RepID=S8A4R1_DACHA|nr:hypothetical protein H072_8248 [Dactylellina haptotyla CBS 200.50]